MMCASTSAAARRHEHPGPNHLSLTALRLGRDLVILCTDCAARVQVRLVGPQAWRCWQCMAGPETIVEQHELVLVFLLLYARRSR